MPFVCVLIFYLATFLYEGWVKCADVIAVHSAGQWALCQLCRLVAGCVEQEDVLQPYSSLLFAGDESSLPHRVSSCHAFVPVLMFCLAAKVCQYGAGSCTRATAVYPGRPVGAVSVLLVCGSCVEDVLQLYSSLPLPGTSRYTTQGEFMPCLA
jgi:hypothetical protein